MENVIIFIMLNGSSVRLLTTEVKLKLRELLNMFSPCLTIVHVDNFLENKIKNIFSEKDSRRRVSNFNKTGLTDRVV